MIGDNQQDPVDPRIDRAVELVRNLPLRWSGVDGGDDQQTVVSRGWFSGADECARVLAAQAPLEIIVGRGFGVSWPMLEAGSWTMAPGLPVAVGEETVAGTDGEYRRDPKGVWREAGGADALFLTTDIAHAAPGVPFDLLWFGDFERFTLRDGVLEIEDLFGVLRAAASREFLERRLVRAKHLDPEVVPPVPSFDNPRPQAIEVQRPTVLSRDDRWHDAVAFLAAREDVESAQLRSGIVEVRVVGGEVVSFGLESGEAGWQLTRRAGRYVFTRICLERGEASLKLCATLDEEVDAMARGMRARLIFDLRADLVSFC